MEENKQELQAQMPEQTLTDETAVQPEAPAPEIPAQEAQAPEAAPEEAAEAPAEIPQEELDAILNQETIRLDDLREVMEMTAGWDHGEGVSDETMRLDEIDQARILEELLAEKREQDRETVNLDNEDDEEGFVNVPILFKPRQRLRELKKQLVAGPEKRYYELAEQGVGKLQLAMLAALVVIGVSAAAAVFYNMGLVLPNRQRLMVFGQILAMLLGALLGCQQMIEGVSDLFHGRFTLNTLLALTFFACCADGFLCLTELRVPICAAFTVEVFMALWADYHRRTTEMGQMDTLRKAIRLDSLVKCPDYYDGKPGFIREEGRLEDFTEHYGVLSGPEKRQNFFALVALIVSLAVAILAFVRHGLSMGVQILSTTLLVAVPASFFVALTRPMAVLERRLHRVGTVLCGWRGIQGLKGRCAFPLTDRDLFSNGASKMNGVKFYGDRDPETVISYAAALMRVNGGSLAPLFEQLLVSHNGLVRDAENVRFYGNGGIGGEVCEEPVLMGTLEFLKEMGVEVPDGVMVKQAVYVSIDGELSGLFAVAYARTKSTLKGVSAICGYRKLIPIVMSEDFMLTPAFLKEKFGIRTRRVVLPERQLRDELMTRQAPQDAQALALMTQEGLTPAAYAVTGARALRTSWKFGMVIHTLGGILGMLIMAALAITGSVELLTPMNVLLYQLIWAVPGLLVTFLARTV